MPSSESNHNTSPNHTLSIKNASLSQWLMFAIPSLIGILLFVTPVTYGGELTIPVALLASLLKTALGDHITWVISVIVCTTGAVTLITKLVKPKVIINQPFLNSLFNVTLLWTLTRLAGAAFIVIALNKFGPEAIWSGNTGGLVLNDLMPTLLAVFIFAGLLLPLLMNFGLLELIGTLMTKIMRPLFGLPGRSAIDCTASWLGDGSVGILMTSKQYENCYYTQREAAVIGTTFSIVSITFSLVVIAQVGLVELFVPFYLTVCLAGLVAAIIVPKLPPLSRKKDIYIDGRPHDPAHEIVPPGHNVFTWGMSQALTTANQVQWLQFVRDGFKNAIDMVFGVLPVVMGIGTIGLMIAEYTPVFNWLGAPFVPLLELLQVPLAKEASTTMMVGFTDMFLPSILVASMDNEMTKFVVAALSLTQLIYLSEVGALLLGSKIPVSLGELFVVFILRTLVTLPVIALAAHLIF